MIKRVLDDICKSLLNFYLIQGLEGQQFFLCEHKGRKTNRNHTSLLGVWQNVAKNKYVNNNMSEIMYSLSYLSSGECLSNLEDKLSYKKSTVQRSFVTSYLFDLLHFHVGPSLKEGNFHTHPSLPLPGPSLLWCDESRQFHLKI